MPHLAALEMASHWILGRYAPKNPVRLHILPSALPPKGEARRYAANDFLNLIELPRGEGCDARIPSSKKAAKPPPYNKALSTSVGMTGGRRIASHSLSHRFVDPSCAFGAPLL